MNQNKLTAEQIADAQLARVAKTQSEAETFAMLRAVCGDVANGNQMRVVIEQDANGKWGIRVGTVTNLRVPRGYYNMSLGAAICEAFCGEGVRL